MKARTLVMDCLCGVLLACSSPPAHVSAPSPTAPPAPVEAAPVEAVPAEAVPVEAAPGAGVAWLGEAGRMRGFTPRAGGDGRHLYAIREGGALDIIDLRTASTRTASLGEGADFTVP